MHLIQLQSALDAKRAEVQQAVDKWMPLVSAALENVTRFKLNVRIPVCLVETLPASVPGTLGAMPGPTGANGAGNEMSEHDLDRLADELERHRREADEDVLGEYVSFVSAAHPSATTSKASPPTLHALGAIPAPVKVTPTGGTSAMTPPFIRIYWLRIALLAHKLGNLEALTIVVLAHELAHGYTECGEGADGWIGQSCGWFKRLDKQLCEGLAEFWSYHAIVAIDCDPNPIRNAYWDLLKGKPKSSPYLAHLPWLSGEDIGLGIKRCGKLDFEELGVYDLGRLETIRLAVVICRWISNVTYSGFRDLLNSIGTQLCTVAAPYVF